MLNNKPVKIGELKDEVTRKITEILNKRDQYETKEQFFNDVKLIERETNRVLELILFSLVSSQDSFYGQFLIRLNRKVDLNLQAPAAVTYRGLYFDLLVNPLLLFDFTPEEIKAIMIHEIYHVCNNHITRGKMLTESVPHYLVNCATDLAINQYIDGLPSGCVSLSNIEKFVPGVDTSLLKPQDNFENYLKVFKDAYNNNQQTQSHVNQMENQRQESQNQTSGNSAGGLIDKIKELKEKGSTSEGNNLDDHNAWQDADTQAGDNESKNVLKKIFEEAKNNSRGTVPASIQQVIDELFAPPTISWQQVLKRYIGTVPVPYKKTITRKSRRQPQRCDLRGRLCDHEIEIIVGLDTSGSMSESDINYALSEIVDIVKNVKSKVTVIECDSQINNTYSLTKVSDINTKVGGRGGTWFEPVFQYLVDNRKKNVILIYFTDGGGESELRPELLKHYKTLWVLTNPYYELSLRNLPKAHGEIKRIQPENERKKK